LKFIANITERREIYFTPQKFFCRVDIHKQMLTIHITLLWIPGKIVKVHRLTGLTY